jgi:GTP-binding protein LepA
MITTAPSVIYKLHLHNGTMTEIHNPADMPDDGTVANMEEPWIKATIFVPDEYLGSILALCTEKRGQQVDLTYVGMRAMVVYRLPLNEIVLDFYDKLKSCTKGYASFDWHMDGYEMSDLVKLNILVNSENVDALSTITHRSRAEYRGREMCARLQDLIPRQMFQIAIQAAIGSRIIARETVKAMRKDVLAKCYGGDISRKRKLLDKQKAGKKRMRNVGNVEIPQSAFIAALKLGNDD